MTKGERIKSLRLQHDMTQEDLGKAIGVIKQTINKYENGTITNIPTDKIEAIAKVFDVTEAYILGWPEQDEKKDMSEAEKILEDFHKNPELKVLFDIAGDLDDKKVKFLSQLAKTMKDDD